MLTDALGVRRYAGEHGNTHPGLFLIDVGRLNEERLVVIEIFRVETVVVVRIGVAVEVESLFAPIMIATLSTCAQLERDNISFRLQSGRKRYIEKGGKLGRKVGSVKTVEQMKAEYREVISLLRKGYSIRDVAKLSGKGVSTVQRVKRLLKVQSPQ